MLYHHVWNGCNPARRTLFCLGTFRFKFIPILFHYTTLFGFVTLQVSVSATRLGVQVDFPGRGVSVGSPFSFWTCDSSLFHSQHSHFSPSLSLIFSNSLSLMLCSLSLSLQLSLYPLKTHTHDKHHHHVDVEASKTPWQVEEFSSYVITIHHLLRWISCFPTLVSF